MSPDFYLVGFLNGFEWNMCIQKIDDYKSNHRVKVKNICPANDVGQQNNWKFFILLFQRKGIKRKKLCIKKRKINLAKHHYLV
jgi:hypothetical protein